MTKRFTLRACAGIGALASVLMTTTAVPALAQDAPPKKHHHHAAAADDRLERLEQRLEDQEQQIQALKASIAAQPQAASAQQVQELQTEVAEAKDEVKSVVEPKDKKIHFHGVTVTLGGFLAAESVWRSNNLESDIGSPAFSKIPFAGPGGGGSGNNVAVGRTGEFRMTARQSRISGLVEGDVDANTHLAMYGEFDFLGAAASANSNESNSYTPRIRNLYGSADWSDIGLHVLFGQSWSLATLDAKGMAERSELAPPTIEAQYVPGFVWTRQPQLRVVKQFGSDFWAGFSLENPQTTIGGTAPTGFTGLTVNSGSGLNGSSTNVALAEFNPGITLTLNHVPDLIGKIAWEPAFFNGNVHLEAVGIYRDFYDRVGTSLATVSNHDTTGGGGGVAGMVKLVPGLLDVQFDTLFGSGIGRYGTSQLPDVTYNANGTLRAVNEDMEMVGVTLHANSALDVYVYAGREHDDASFFNGTINGTTQHIGYGNPVFVNTGCFSYTLTSSCTGNIQTSEQVTAGLWDTAYSGDFGKLKIGLQYSYTEEDAFLGTGGAPHTSDNMIFTSFRYYPF